VAYIAPPLVLDILILEEVMVQLFKSKCVPTTYAVICLRSELRYSIKTINP